MVPPDSAAENPAGNVTYVNRLTPVNPTSYPAIELDGPLSFHNSGDITTTRANFGLAIGTNVQAHSSILDSIVSDSGTVNLSGLTLTLPSIFVTTTYGTSNTAAGTNGVAIGESNSASATDSFAVGSNNTASGNASHAFGHLSTASNSYAHAEGEHTTASGSGSHTEGDETSATADYSHAEGQSSVASGFASHAEGEHTAASGQTGHTEGQQTTASGTASHAEGFGAIAAQFGQHAQATTFFATPGDQQFTSVVMAATTTDATPTNLSNNATAFTLVAGKSYAFTVRLAARVHSGGTNANAFFIRQGIIDFDGGTAALDGAVNTIGTDIDQITTGGVVISADTVNNALQIQVTGAAGKNIAWVAFIECVEIAY